MKVYYTILLIVLTVSLNVLGAKRELYVYLPYTNITAKNFKELLESEISGIKIEVFKRKDDFIEKIEEKKPGAILTMSMVIEDVNTKGIMDYEIKLVGSKEGKTDEPYSFFVKNIGSINDSIKLNYIIKNKVDSLFPTIVCVLDFAKQEKKEAIIRGFIEGQQIKVIKVAGFDNLLNIIRDNPNIAKAGFIPYRLMPHFTGISKLRFFFYNLPDARMGICVLAISKDENKHYYVKYVKKFSQEIMEIIGVDQWKKK